ncbi:uncharacterized protein LOC112048463 [Bicyclus anynana]|uniref:Uncharacterized protein LOC112048463 n=1 Tax=Bicyclus anynana TaxID=110368 RepID=A0A6J1N9L0_BICAN|nr:uncharacterized protein LOC112048463 [Bicyclus anynana]
MEYSNEVNEVTATNAKTKSSWIYLLRQIFVCSGVTSYFFIFGLFFGAPTVYVPQIRKEANSTEIISMETMSWLYGITNYGSLPWTAILPIIAARYGRKIPYYLLWVNTIVCVALFYFSTSILELFISGLFQGMLPAMLFTVTVMTLTEYTSPKYRGIFITFKGATFYWGVWISNAIGTFFHWKNIGILMFLCCVYNISVIFWPESPMWLATKGRFEECAKSHRWLKGEEKDSEEELKQLIDSQKMNIELKQQRHQEKQNFIVKLYKILRLKQFYKPLTISILTMCLYHFSGKLACTGYIVHILKTISESESSAYMGMLFLDGITVGGMYVGVILTKFLKRRTILISSSLIGIIFLIVLSVYLYLVHLNVISQNTYVTILLLTGFSVTISCGPLIMSMCFSSELTPLKGRSLFLCVFAVSCNIIMGSNMKMFPYIFEYLNSHGAFILYAIISSGFLYILYKVLPETKDRTIHEIEKYFVDENNVKNKEDALMNTEKPSV